MAIIYYTFINENVYSTYKNKHMAEHEIAYDLLEKVLLENYKISQPLVFEKGEFGKPYLKDYPQIHFNLSHCNGLIVCAVDTLEVGIDCEKIDKMHLKAVRRIFSDDEILLLENTTPTYQSEVFFKIWTAKIGRAHV